MKKRPPYIPAHLYVLWRHQLGSKDPLLSKEEKRLIRHVLLRQAESEIESLSDITEHQGRTKRKVARAAAATLATLALATCSGGIPGARPPDDARRIEGSLTARLGARRRVDDVVSTQPVDAVTVVGPRQDVVAGRTVNQCHVRLPPSRCSSSSQLVTATANSS